MVVAPDGSALPERSDYYVATVTVLRQVGGMANIEEIEAHVAALLTVPEAALKIPHGDGRRSQFQYDLAWVRTYLKWAGALDNPERGIWALTPLGNVMSDAELRQVWSRIVRERRKSDATPPRLPTQGPGPNFTIKDQVLSFAAQVDQRGNDQKRLRSLHPILLEMSDRLVSLMARDAGLWPQFEAAAQSYHDVLNVSLRTIDFGRLFGQGLLLANTAKAAGAAAEGGNSYSLPADLASLLDSLLGLHGAFMMGSHVGQALVVDAHNFNATGQDIADLRNSELEISRALAQPDAPVSAEVRRHVRAIIEVETSARPDQYNAYRGAMVRNAAIVVAGGAVLATVASLIVPGVYIPAVGTYMAVLFGSEALKKSKAGRGVTDQLANIVDKATVDFVMNNLEPLRTLSKAPQMRLLGEVLSWLPRHAAIEHERIEPSMDSVHGLAATAQVMSAWSGVEYAIYSHAIERGLTPSSATSTEALIDELQARRSSISADLLFDVRTLAKDRNKEAHRGRFTKSEAAEFVSRAKDIRKRLQDLDTWG